MTLFGKVQSYDDNKGTGMIKPETGGEPLNFERSAVNWGKENSSKTDRRLSYEVGKNSAGHACAINLRSA
jgi:cold shock protein